MGVSKSSQQDNNESTKPVKILIVGAGSRGKNYARYAIENPKLCSVVGVAEPRPLVLEQMKNTYSATLNPSLILNDWKQLTVMAEDAVNELLAEVDAVIICLQDRLHYECCLWFANHQKHVLLEKPMALTVDECNGIYQVVEKNGIMFAVCHVLRYSEVTQKVKSILTENGIGKVMNIQHLEPVGYFHFAHSYVRGNWRKTSDSSFSLMTKSCHDIDWICYIMNDRNNQCFPSKISSFGSLSHFRKENKPDGAADRCLDCPAHVENKCAYSAKKIYLDLVKQGHTGWPCSVIVESGDVPDIENITDALRNTNYGKCVFGDAGNDVVDNQVVQILFDNGTTCSFSMVAFSQEICERQTRIHGTEGQLEISGNQITHINFLNGTRTKYDFDDMSRPEAPKTSLSNHGYADYFLMKHFIEAVAFNDPNKLVSNAKETLHSHLAVFAAEDARLSGNVIDFAQWLKDHNCS